MFLLHLSSNSNASVLRSKEVLWKLGSERIHTVMWVTDALCAHEHYPNNLWWLQLPYLCWMPCCYDFRAEGWVKSFQKSFVPCLAPSQCKRHFKLLVLEWCWAPGFWQGYSGTWNSGLKSCILFCKWCHPIYLHSSLSFSKSAWEYQSWEVGIIFSGLS